MNSAESAAHAFELLGVSGAKDSATVTAILLKSRIERERRNGVYVFTFPDGSCISTCGDAWDVSRPCGCWDGSECEGCGMQRHEHQLEVES